MKNIILAIPNSASQSLKACINRFSDHHCEQYMNLFDKPKNYHSYDGKLISIRRAYSFLHQKLYLNSKLHDYQSKLSVILKSSEYECLGNYHSDICSFDTKTQYHLESLVSEKFIAKQHFPPTLSNRIFLRDFSKVILIRDPEEVVQKYEKQGRPLVSSPVFRQKLVDEITMWIELWSEEPNTLVIRKNDLVSDSRRILKQMGDYTGIQFDLDNNFEFPIINKSKSKF